MKIMIFEIFRNLIINNIHNQKASDCIIMKEEVIFSNNKSAPNLYRKTFELAFLRIKLKVKFLSSSI